LLSETLGPRVRLDEAADALELRWQPGDPALDWPGRLGDLSRRLASESVRTLRYGMKALRSYAPNDPRRPTVCLVHGMNSSSGGFVHLIPLLEAQGLGVVVYDYPFDRDLDQSADAFARDWAAFRLRAGEQQPWIVLAHSMGALLARDYVEGPAYGRDVSHLFLIAPPNQGSAVAEFQGLMKAMEGLQSLASGKADLARFREGLGDAAVDLVPGSAFLKALNARPRREGVAYHILAGNAGFLDAAARRQLETRVRGMQQLGGVLGSLGRLALGSLPAQLDEVSDETGDGCVAVRSTRLDGVTDHQVIRANHVELIRGPLLYPDPGPVACMPFVVERLERASGRTPAGR
jgi:pimeloyl-ACP methyl ester carboxylesterase